VIEIRRVDQFQPALWFLLWPVKIGTNILDRYYNIATDMIRKLFSILALAMTSLPSMACDYCGCFAGITPYDNQSGISLMYRYKSLNGYSSANQAHKIFPDGSLRLANPAGNDIQHTEDGEASFSSNEYETYRALDLHGKYFIHQRIEVDFLLPFSKNKHEHPEDGEKHEAQGVGDLFLYAGYHLVRRPDAAILAQRLIVGGGVKLPTGAYRFSENGIRIHEELQPGTGTTDGFAFLNYVAGFRHWGANLYGLHKKNGINSYEERVADNTTGQFSLFYKFKKGKWFLIPSAQATYEYTRGLIVNKMLEDGTGANLLTSGLGLDVYFKNIGMNAAFHLPVYEKVSGPAMSNAARITIGLCYNFNQVNYWLDRK